jgi:type IV pilus assembly protein PilM
MAVQPGVWGIDIGQCALKAMRLQLVDGKVTATAFDYVEHPKILSQPDADPDQLTREALEKFLSRNQTKGDKVAVGVPGQSGLARFVKLPPVEEKKISDIVKFEAKQQIPFPLEEVVWDFQKVSEGTVEGGFAIDTEIGLFAMKRDMINRCLNHFQGVNVEVHVIQMSPLALCNYVTYDMLNKCGTDAPATADAAAAPAAAPAPPSKKKCVVALDIGTDGSNLIITDGGKIIWQRPIPIGGNHFTRALTKELKLTFAKAEHLKRNAAKSPELASILKALKPVLTDFVGEVQRSLGYFTNTHRDAQVEYMVGLGSAFKLPGLQKYLGDKLQLRVEKPAKFTRLAGEAVTNAPVFIENLLTFPIAYGLALQGLGASRLTTNLLPPEITWDRKIRAKKPWAVSAAAMLLLGTGVLAFGYSLPYAAVNDPNIPKALDKCKDAKEQATQLDSQINAKKREQDDGLEKVQAIVAGDSERKNWIGINEYVNNSLPVPGPGGNLTGELEKLWNFKEGGIDCLGATQKYYDRIHKGVDPKTAFLEDDLRQYLAAVDVEAVHCRYTTNLEGFFKNAKQYCKDYIGSGDAMFDAMDKADRDPLMADPPVFPKGAGWVVEVRGTTWYERGTIKGPEFLRLTLLEFLKANAKLLNAKDKDKEPIRGKISHIFLYGTWKDENPRPDTYHFIQASLIDQLVASSASADQSAAPSSPASPSGPATPGIMGGENRGAGGSTGTSAWTPLSGGSASAAMGGNFSAAFGPMIGGGSGGSGGGGGNTYQRSATGGGPDNGKSPLGTPSGKEDAPSKSPTKIKPRYEFVVVFVWKELTPSDRFIKASPAGPGGNAPKSGFPSGPGIPTGAPGGPMKPRPS